jgi:hypothetical protein
MTPSAVRDLYKNLVALLAPGVPAVEARVLLALEQPLQYAATSAHSLEQRGIGRVDVEAKSVDLPWIALVDALSEHRLLIEVDWKEEPGEVVMGLQRLASLPHELRSQGLAATDEDDMTTEAFLKLVAKRLRRSGLELAFLDIQSDSYPLVLLRREPSVEARKLAKACGHAIHLCADDRSFEPAKPLPTTAVTVVWERSHDMERSLEEFRNGRVTLDELRRTEAENAEQQSLREMVVAQNASSDPTEVARTTTDPALCLRAAAYLTGDVQRRFDVIGTIFQRSDVVEGATMGAALDEALAAKGADRDAFQRLPQELQSTIRRHIYRYYEQHAAKDVRWTRGEWAPRSLALVGDEACLRLLERLTRNLPPLAMAVTAKDGLSASLELERIERGAINEQVAPAVVAGPRPEAPIAAPTRVRHRSLGEGHILRVLEGDKVEVRFAHETKILVRSFLEVLPDES